MRGPCGGGDWRCAGRAAAATGDARAVRRRRLAMRGPCGGGDWRCAGRLAAATVDELRAGPFTAWAAWEGDASRCSKSLFY